MDRIENEEDRTVGEPKMDVCYLILNIIIGLRVCESVCANERLNGRENEEV